MLHAHLKDRKGERDRIRRLCTSVMVHIFLGFDMSNNSILNLLGSNNNQLPKQLRQKLLLRVTSLYK
jgi:hypothetical protein